MNLEKRLRNLEQVPVRPVPTKPMTEAQKALASIKRLWPLVLAERERDPEAREQERRETRLRLGIDPDKTLTPADLMVLMKDVQARHGRCD